MIFGKIKELYLGLKYGYTKRPERLKLHGIVTISPIKFRHEEEHYKRTAVIDVSSSGIAIESFDEFKVDDEVIIMFSMPQHRVSIAGFIKRKRITPPTFVYGIRFNKEQTDKNTIKQVLSYARAEMKKARMG